MKKRTRDSLRTPRPLPAEPDKYYLIEGDRVRKLRALATRLYSERRMNGDEMRDAGHLLIAIADECEQLQLPEDT